MKHSEMTTFEIDAAIAAITFPEKKVTNFAGEAVVWFGNLETRVVRYCTSWSDAGPLIQNSKIDLEAPFGPLNLWEAKSRDDKGRMVHWCADCNPLRAAMVVYLMMHGESQPETDNYRQIENDGREG